MERRRRPGDKVSHIEVALDKGAEATSHRGLTFDQIRLRPNPLPEVDFASVDVSATLVGKKISAPIMISPMTGGVKEGGRFNLKMAAAAEEKQIPFAVGSQRVALEDQTRAEFFQVRKVAPTIPVFANVGAVQLVKGYSVEHCKRAVDMLGADALYLHLNAMQEVVQEGGDTGWTGVLRAIERVVEALEQGGPPVFVREVGFGFTATAAKRLMDIGVAGLDCAGAGGTSWSKVEGLVSSSWQHTRLGETFASWGLTTPESIREVREFCPTLPLVASGGLRTGLDAAKAIGLGADIAGFAAPILRAAHAGEEDLYQLLDVLIYELRAAIFGVGAHDIPSFRLAAGLD